MQPAQTRYEAMYCLWEAYLLMATFGRPEYQDIDADRRALFESLINSKTLFEYVESCREDVVRLCPDVPDEWLVSLCAAALERGEQLDAQSRDRLAEVLQNGIYPRLRRERVQLLEGDTKMKIDPVKAQAALEHFARAITEHGPAIRQAMQDTADKFPRDDNAAGAGLPGSQAGAEKLVQAQPKGMPLEKAINIAEDLFKTRPVPSARKMAKAIGCSLGQIPKIMEQSQFLRDKKAAEKASKKQSVSLVQMTHPMAQYIGDTAEQTTEDDPVKVLAQAEVEEKHRKIQADPMLRALWEASSAKERQRFIDDVPLEKLKQMALLACQQRLDERTGKA